MLSHNQKTPSRLIDIWGVRVNNNTIIVQENWSNRPKGKNVIVWISIHYQQAIMMGTVSLKAIKYIWDQSSLLFR